MTINRREFLQAGLYGIGIGAAGVLPVPPLFARAAQALATQAANGGRILVVLELSGGNDGLNTLVPYGDDAYYRHRPKIGIRAASVRKIDARQSLAVRSRLHTPIVFDDPNKFAREGFYQERDVLAETPDSGSVDNPSRRFLLDVARSARSASALVKEAWAKYKSPVDYG